MHYRLYADKPMEQSNIKNRNLYLHHHHLSYSGLYPYIYPMDIHRQITNTHRTRSNNLTYSRHTVYASSLTCLHKLYLTTNLLLQTQSLILLMLFSSFAALCFHMPFCWILVYKLKLGSSAAALASASS